MDKIMHREQSTPQQSVRIGARSNFRILKEIEIFTWQMISHRSRLCVEVTTSSDDLSYFLLVWNTVTILQHFLFCKWQGIQECLHRRFPIAILPAVWTWFIVFTQPFIQIVLQHLNRFVDLFSNSNLIEFRENRFMKSLADSIRLRRFCFRFCAPLP